MAGRSERSAAQALEQFSRERELYLAGHLVIAGVDEAGRGPLAGPVYAAAVILPVQQMLADAQAGNFEQWYFKVKDSKALSETAREKLRGQILEKAPAWGIGSASVREIDELNILRATFLAMRRALEALQQQPDLVLVDGNAMIPGLLQPQLAVVAGDARTCSIAAASILAKTARDRVLCDLDSQYPQYGFARHKGYGTKDHVAALRRLGPCPEHRLSFLGKVLSGQLELGF